MINARHAFALEIRRHARRLRLEQRCEQRANISYRCILMSIDCTPLLALRPDLRNETSRSSHCA
jgi:hypothetical protein